MGGDLFWQSSPEAQASKKKAMLGKNVWRYLLQCSTIIIMTAPISAELTETITSVRTQPSSPADSVTNEISN